MYYDKLFLEIKSLTNFLINLVIYQWHVEYGMLQTEEVNEFPFLILQNNSWFEIFSWTK